MKDRRVNIRQFADRELKSLAEKACRDVRAIRHQSGKTQQTISNLTGMYAQTISNIENGRFTNFTIETLARFAKALDTRLEIKFSPLKNRAK